MIQTAIQVALSAILTVAQDVRSVIELELGVGAVKPTQLIAHMI